MAGQRCEVSSQLVAEVGYFCQLSCSGSPWLVSRRLSHLNLSIRVVPNNVLTKESIITFLITRQVAMNSHSSDGRHISEEFPLIS